MPTGVMSTLASIFFSLLAAKWSNRRCLVCMLACLVPIAGTGVLYGVSRSAVAAQLAGLYLVSHHCSHVLNTLLIFAVLHLLRSLRRRYFARASKHSRPHQEKRPVRNPLHRLRCWKLDWPTDIPRKPSARLHGWCCRYVGKLLRCDWTDGSVLGSLCIPESWRGCAYGRDWG